MRRAAVVLSATAAGLAGVLTFHSHRPASKVAVGTPATTPATPSTPATPASPAAPSPTSPTTASPTTSAPASNGHATGAVEPYRYGELSVTVTKSNGHITDVEIASLNETDSRSVAIDNDAIPQLRQEVLNAQRANIDGVSGATFTSQAYAASVQSALDQLGAG